MEDHLDEPLLYLSPNDTWDVRAALTHTLVFGTTGSGKTSTTIKSLVLSMLWAGFGALFCVAKPEDARAIRQWCAQAGRLNSLLDWNGTNGGYNFLAAELAWSGNINNVIDLLQAVLAMIRDSGPNPSRAGDQFWADAVLQMLRAAVPVIFAATGTVRIRDILDFIRSAPTSPEQMRDTEWQRTSHFYQIFRMAAERLAAGPIAGFDDEAAERALNYWRDDVARLDPKTAGNIRISVSTALSRFEHGWLKEAFCGETTLCPELLMSGAIILMDFPVQTHGEDAQIAQKLFKYLCQRCLLARNAMEPHLRTRPVAIFADEAHNFLYRDAEFLAQCRSSLVAVVMATQSLPTLYSMIGGDHPHDRTHHLISNFNNIVLHSTACPETAEWFARKIGKGVQRRSTFSENQGTNDNYGSSLGEGSSWNRAVEDNGFFNLKSLFRLPGNGWDGNGSEGGGGNWGRNRSRGSSHGTSWGYNESVDWIIEPGFFARGLKTGGPANGNRVSAIWYQAGRRFAASNGNALLVEMQQ